LPKALQNDRFKGENSVSDIKRFSQRGFPGAGCGRRKYEDRALGLKDGLQVAQTLKPQLREFSAAMIKDRAINGSQNAVWNVAWSWYLKKMSTRLVCDAHLLRNFISKDS